MRSITLTRAEFDDTFFPMVTSGRTPAKDENEHEIAIRLIKQLKDPAITFPEDPKPKAIEQIEESGNRWWPSYKQNDDEYKWDFEEDVYKIIRHRLKEQIPFVHPMMAEEFDVVWQKVKKSETWDMNAEKDLDEDEDKEEQSPEPMEAVG